MNVHFSSDRHDWRTPDAFYQRLNEIYRFRWDAAATAENSKFGGRYFGPDHRVIALRDALTIKWPAEDGPYWLNPPYGREIVGFMRKAWESSCKGATVVCLVPARTDTAWWHEYVMHAESITLVRGRLRFDGHQNCAPFPSAVVVFRMTEATKFLPPDLWTMDAKE